MHQLQAESTECWCFPCRPCKARRQRDHSGSAQSPPLCLAHLSTEATILIFHSATLLLGMEGEPRSACSCLRSRPPLQQKKREASRRRAACRLAKNVRPSGYVAVMRRPGSDPVDAPFSATVSQPIDPYQSVVERIGHRLSPGLLAVTPMNSFVCRCPKTGLPVQGWNIDASRSIGVQPSSRTPTERQDAYQGEHCPVCARLHLVNPETGKLLGEGENIGTARRTDKRTL